MIILFRGAMSSGESIEKWAQLGRALIAVGGSKPAQAAAGAQAIGMATTAPGMIADKLGWGTGKEDAMREQTIAEHEEARARQQQKTQANVNTGGIHNAPQTPSTSSVMGVGKGEPMDLAMRLLKDFVPGINCTECGDPLPPNEAQTVMGYGTTPMCLPCLRGREWVGAGAGAEPEFSPDWQNVRTGEPMDIAMRLLKQKKPDPRLKAAGAIDPLGRRY